MCIKMNGPFPNLNIVQYNLYPIQIAKYSLYLPVLSLAFLSLSLHIIKMIPGTSPIQPRVKLTAGPMCIEMDGLFKNKKRFSPFECI